MPIIVLVIKSLPCHNNDPSIFIYFFHFSFFFLFQGVVKQTVESAVRILVESILTGSESYPLCEIRLCSMESFSAESFCVFWLCWRVQRQEAEIEKPLAFVRPMFISTICRKAYCSLWSSLFLYRLFLRVWQCIVCVPGRGWLTMMHVAALRVKKEVKSVTMRMLFLGHHFDWVFPVVTTPSCCHHEVHASEHYQQMQWNVQRHMATAISDHLKLESTDLHIYTFKCTCDE